MIFKKLRLVFISLVLVFVLTGCDFETEDPECNDNQQVVDGECVDIVVEDTTAPEISGTSDLAYVIGDDAPDYYVGVTASDLIDGDVTSSIVVDSSLVDLETAGTYEVTFTVSDAALNETVVTIDITVTVRELTDLEKVELDIAALDFSEGFTLTTFGANGTSFFWLSGNRNVISNRGLVIMPPIGSDPVTVTLTATVYNGDYAGSYSVDVIVDPRDESVVTSRVVMPFEALGEEYICLDDPEVDIFFVDNGTVPYIDVETFIDLIDGAIESDELVYTAIGDDVLELTYDVEWEDFDGLMVTETFTATIDFTENTFTVNSFSFFDNYGSETESDYGEGLEYVDADYRDASEVTIPLGDYTFDLIIYEEAGTTYYLMPFHVANLLFAGGIYYDVYYNGETLYGIEYLMADDGDALMETVKASSFNNLNAEIDLKEASYHFMALALDYFYGLRVDQGVDSYYGMLAGYADYIINKSDYDLYDELFEVAYDLDDLHTSHAFTGINVSATYTLGLSLSDVGPDTKDFYEGMWAVQDLIEAKYGSLDDYPEYRLIDDGKTAIIYLKGFTIDTPPEVKTLLDALPATVENVVFDLSYNTGGNIGAVFRIFGYMTEDDIVYHSQNPADGSAATWYIQSDYDAYDYEWYIVTSSVTFSAANLMTSMAKEMGIATIIGQDSSGGASSIGLIITPDGTGLIITTNNVLTTRIEGEYYSIEYGIEVDYEMDDVTSDEEIIEIINTVNALTE